MKALIKMDSIDKTAQRSFFIGALTLILDFKIQQYEKNDENSKEVKESLDSVYQHHELLEKMSTLVYFEYSLLRAAFHFNSENNDILIFRNLLSSFKTYKTYRNFRKR